MPRVALRAAGIDSALDRLANARPDPNAADLGAPVEIETLRDNWRSASAANFRYYAGFLGWGDADLQQRLARYRDGVHRWNASVRAIAPSRRRPRRVRDGCSAIEVASNRSS